MPPWLVGSFISFAALVLGVLLLAYVTSLRLTNPPDYVHPREPSFRYTKTPLTEHGLSFQDVEIPVAAAGVVRGWLVPAPSQSDQAVLTVHGRAGDRAAFLPLAPDLHRAGAAVLLIDLRENGLSDGAGRGTGLGMREADDIEAAADALRKKGFKHITVIGCSLGASAALIAASRSRLIDGVVADSALESMERYVADEAYRHMRRFPFGGAISRIWGKLVIWVSQARLSLATVTAAEQSIAAISPRPVLLIQGSEDRAVAPSHANELYARAQNPKSIWIVEGAGHCGALSADAKGYAARVIELMRLARQ